MRKILTTTLLLLFYCTIFAQTKPNNWALLEQQNGVEVYYKYAQCDQNIGYDKELVLLKFVNTSAERIKTISWDLEAYWGRRCVTCESPDEYHMEIRLEPEESMEGTCDIECDYKLKVFSKFTDPDCKKVYEPLDKFELANFTVSK